MPPSESTMPLCDLLARVRSYWLGEERRLDEKCQQRGLELALADRKLETKHKRALRLYRRGKIEHEEMVVRHAKTLIKLSIYEVKARNGYGEERFKRSGKSFTDFIRTPNVWDFCRNALFKACEEPLTEKELEDYLSDVTWKIVKSADRTSTMLVRLDKDGFKTELLEDLWTEYQADVAAMKLSRATTRDTTIARATPTRTKRAKRTNKVVKRSHAKRDEFTAREEQFLACWARGLSMAEIKDELGVDRSRVYQLKKNAARRNVEIFALAEKLRDSAIEERRRALPRAIPPSAKKSVRIQGMKKADEERVKPRKRA